MHQLPRTQSNRLDNTARQNNAAQATSLRDNSSAQTHMAINSPTTERMGTDLTDIGQLSDERQALQNRNASKLNQIIQVWGLILEKPVLLQNELY